MQDHAEREQGATFLELFFDLVFVYAITQVAAFIHHEGDVEAYLRAALIFGMIWWAWSQFTWAGNGINLRDRRATVATLAATGAAFFLAQDVPAAFTSEGEWFSVPFALTMLIGNGLYWWGLRDEPEHQRALLTYLPLTALAVLVAGAGGFASESAQPWAYLGALGLFLAATITAQRGTPFHIYPRHFAERHALIVIVALGESVIAVGVGAQGLERSGEFALAAAVGVAAVCLLWWSYFDWFQEATEHVLRGRPAHDRASLARDLYTWLHLPIVFGVVCIAVAAEEVLAHPGDHLEAIGWFGLAAGTLLFQGGIIAAHYRGTGRLLVERSIGAGVAVAAVAAFRDLDALLLAALVVAIIVASLAVERVRGVGVEHPAPVGG
ncbi:MAG: low temperature requirement protein A [Dehalococcoidia bacterium]